MGVAIIARPTPINQDSSLVAYEFAGVAPAVAGVQASAAAADHRHQVGLSSRQVTGFGLAAQISSNYNGGGAAGFTGVNALPALTQWTIEFFMNINGAGIGGLVGLLQATSSTQPFPNGTLVCGFGGQNLSPGQTWWNAKLPDGTVINELDFTGYGSPPVFYAMCCDGTETRVYVNGSLVATGAAGELYYTPGGVFGFISTGSQITIDEFRVSNISRYAANFTPPQEPFTPDGATLILWDFDEQPYGEWFNSASYASGPVIYSEMYPDASGLGNNGTFEWNGQYGATSAGISSPITADSGPGYAPTVLSVDASRGDIVLTDTAGNQIGSAVQQSNGPTQVQMPVMQFKGAWSSSVAYAVGDVVTSGGNSYVCLANNTNNVPPNATYWSEVGGGGGTLAHTYEQEITVTTAVTALTYTPTTSGLFRISFYFRVVTAATDVTVTVTTTDATGAQTWDVLPITSEAVGSYQLDAITVAGTSGDPIDVVVTAGTANQVYFSSSIEEG